jgi:uncharacterized protein YpiB (UPF0302 family)
MKKLAIIIATLFALPSLAFDKEQLIAAGEYAKDRERVERSINDLKEDPDSIIYIEINFKRIRLDPPKEMSIEARWSLSQLLKEQDDELLSKIDKALRVKKEASNQ